MSIILILSNFLIFPLFFSLLIRRFSKFRYPRLTGWTTGLLLAVIFAVIFPKVPFIYNTVFELLEPEETIYSVNYDESHFKKIEKNMDFKKVLEILGEPLERVKLSDSREIWRYSKQGPHNINYLERNIIFLSGRVVEIDSSFYID